MDASAHLQYIKSTLESEHSAGVLPQNAAMLRRLLEGRLPVSGPHPTGSGGLPTRARFLHDFTLWTFKSMYCHKKAHLIKVLLFVRKPKLHF